MNKRRIRFIGGKERVWLKISEYINNKTNYNGK